MPKAAPRPCNSPGCGRLTYESHCPEHKRQHHVSTWNEYHAGRTRQERGYGRAWERKRITVLRRDGYLCQPCLARGLSVEATEVDHITAKSRGGTDDEDNLQAICAPCHRAKTAKDRKSG